MFISIIVARYGKLISRAKILKGTETAFKKVAINFGGYSYYNYNIFKTFSPFF